VSSLARCRCRHCQTEFEARWGGGFRYADRFCPECGAWRCLQYSEDPRTWEAFQTLNLTFQQPQGPLHERQGRIAQAAAELDAQVRIVLGPMPLWRGLHGRETPLSRLRLGGPSTPWARS